MKETMRMVDGCTTSESAVGTDVDIFGIYRIPAAELDDHWSTSALDAPFTFLYQLIVDVYRRHLVDSVDDDGSYSWTFDDGVRIDLATNDGVWYGPDLQETYHCSKPYLYGYAKDRNGFYAHGTIDTFTKAPVSVWQGMYDGSYRKAHSISDDAIARKLPTLRDQLPFITAFLEDFELLRQTLLEDRDDEQKIAERYNAGVADKYAKERHPYVALEDRNGNRTKRTNGDKPMRI